MNKLTISYNATTETIRASNNALIAFKQDGRWLLDIDGCIPLNLAIKLFTRFQSTHNFGNPLQIAKSLNDAINTRLYIKLGARTVPVYYNDKLNVLGIESGVNSAGMAGKIYDKFNAHHDIIANHVRIWINDEIILDAPIVDAV